MAILYILHTFFLLAAAYPANYNATESETRPIPSSSELWASVVANIAPLMALVGERHAKEYLRSIARKQQIFNLCVAPIGILSILVSAVRLSGASYLRRLIGRESEKRSEAMVEVTPVSLSEATPVYVDGRIEVEPSSVKDAAFVCCHHRPSDARGTLKESAIFRSYAVPSYGIVESARL
jgi:hypothetical protein